MTSHVKIFSKIDLFLEIGNYLGLSIKAMPTASIYFIYSTKTGEDQSYKLKPSNEGDKALPTSTMKNGNNADTYNIPIISSSHAIYLSLNHRRRKTLWNELRVYPPYSISNVLAAYDYEQEELINPTDKEVDEGITD
jgi:hypothetical protein